jgi:hypothetical protein
MRRSRIFLAVLSREEGVGQFRHSNHGVDQWSTKFLSPHFKKWIISISLAAHAVTLCEAQEAQIEKLTTKLAI